MTKVQNENNYWDFTGDESSSTPPPNHRLSRGIKLMSTHSSVYETGFFFIKKTTLNIH